MEPLIAIVGFLGAGKTTLLKELTIKFIEEGWNPYVILNDYENANLDAQQLAKQIDPEIIKTLNGSCICCSGIDELRKFVNRIPKRDKGVTIIEANGTSDACSLMGFLGVGIDKRFAPPVQISVVDVKNWQNRGEHNELEANQIQVSSAILLTHLDGISDERKTEVIDSIRHWNPYAEIMDSNDFKVFLLSSLKPSTNAAEKLEHHKAHWASCSVDLFSLPNKEAIKKLCGEIPESILRVKGCTKIGKEESYTYFERTPDMMVSVRPYHGVPVTGPKLLTIGPGSDPKVLEEILLRLLRATPKKTKRKLE
jgi:G3E family GTPase